MIELEELNELKNHVHLYKVENGYAIKVTVPREKPVKQSGPFTDYESKTREAIHVFSNLADVVSWLGNHYQEPTNGLKFEGVQNG